MAVRRHPVTTMILARVAVGVVALFVISSMLFVALELLPGDFADAILGRGRTPERLAAAARPWASIAPHTCVMPIGWSAPCRWIPEPRGNGVPRFGRSSRHASITGASLAWQ